MTIQEIEAIIEKNMRYLFPELEEADFGTHDKFKELGLDAVDRGELALMTIQAVGLTIPSGQFERAKNIKIMAKKIHKKL